MIKTTVNIYRVNVIFDAQALAFTYSGDMVYIRPTGPTGPTGPAVPTLTVSSGIHLINFTLETTNSATGAAASFVSISEADPFPIVFIADGSPRTGVASPVNYVPNIWRNDTYCSLVAMNLNHIPNWADPRPFVVKVMYETILYTSSDPTIINDPPAQGSGS